MYGTRSYEIFRLLSDLTSKVLFILIKTWLRHKENVIDQSPEYKYLIRIPRNTQKSDSFEGLVHKIK